jgi:hypothetical protein
MPLRFPIHLRCVAAIQASSSQLLAPSCSPHFCNTLAYSPLDLATQGVRPGHPPMHLGPGLTKVGTNPHENFSLASFDLCESSV